MRHDLKGVARKERLTWWKSMDSHSFLCSLFSGSPLSFVDNLLSFYLRFCPCSPRLGRCGRWIPIPGQTPRWTSSIRWRWWQCTSTSGRRSWSACAGPTKADTNTIYLIRTSVECWKTHPNYFNSSRILKGMSRTNLAKIYYMLECWLEKHLSG